MKRFLLVLSLLLTVSAGFALAQSDDPPSRVARLNYQTGQVSFRPDGVEEWTAASLNYPLTNGDRLWTEDGARVEMHVGTAVLRLDSKTAFTLTRLDDRVAQFSLTEGSLDIHLRDLDPDERFEIDTPNATISLLRPGDYRIDADADRAITAVSVRSGEADVSTGGNPFPVRATQSARLTGTDTVSQELAGAPALSELERWGEERDRREDSSDSARYVPRDLTGYEDLDANGDWSQDPEYGMVWAPRMVVAGWAPYRYGRWVWIQPWGWTWVDDAPWGFAPFHYGRWTYARTRWVWIPGRRDVRPVYAPALVVFVGGPSVTWFPLGPREVYRPGYRVSELYVRRINVTHVNVTNINVTNVRYVNREVPGAVTSVTRETFVTAGPVGRSHTVVSRTEVERAQVIVAPAGVAPRRESRVWRPETNVRVVTPPVRYTERTVVHRNVTRNVDVVAPPRPENTRNERPNRVERPVQRDIEPRRTVEPPRPQPQQQQQPIQRDIERRRTEPTIQQQQQQQQQQQRNVERSRNPEQPRKSEPPPDRPRQQDHKNERVQRKNEHKEEKKQ